MGQPSLSRGPESRFCGVLLTSSRCVLTTACPRTPDIAVVWFEGGVVESGSYAPQVAMKGLEMGS